MATTALRSKRGLTVMVAAVVVLVGLLAVGWFVVRPQVQMARACDTVKALNVLRDDSVPVSDGPRTALVFGDSYAQGWDLPDPRGSWPAEFGERAGYEVTVNAVGSSGLLHAGMCQGTGIVSRVQADAPDADLLVIQTGLNDVWSSDSDLKAAVADIAAASRSQVVLVGPTDAPGMRDEDVARVDATLHAAASDAGWVYVPLFNLAGLSYLDDGVHVDEASQVKIGVYVAESID